jgi:hypothetical protein
MGKKGFTGLPGSDTDDIIDDVENSREVNFAEKYKTVTKVIFNPKVKNELGLYRDALLACGYTVPHMTSTAADIAKNTKSDNQLKSGIIMPNKR